MKEAPSGGDSSDLISAFSTARYLVFEPNIEFNVGEVSEDLNMLLKKNKKRSFAFITPFNPGSRVITLAENELRIHVLSEELKGYIKFEGQGGGQDEMSPTERSFLVLGISLSKAKQIGRRFGQDAIVFGRLNKPSMLVVLNENL